LDEFYRVAVKFFKKKMLMNALTLIISLNAYASATVSFTYDDIDILNTMIEPKVNCSSIGIKCQDYAMPLENIEAYGRIVSIVNPKVTFINGLTPDIGNLSGLSELYGFVFKLLGFYRTCPCRDPFQMS